MEDDSTQSSGQAATDKPVFVAGRLYGLLKHSTPFGPVLPGSEQRFAFGTGTDVVPGRFLLGDSIPHPLILGNYTEDLHRQSWRPVPKTPTPPRDSLPSASLSNSSRSEILKWLSASEPDANWDTPPSLNPLPEPNRWEELMLPEASAYLRVPCEVEDSGSEQDFRAAYTQREQEVVVISSDSEETKPSVIVLSSDSETAPPTPATDQQHATKQFHDFCSASSVL